MKKRIIGIGYPIVVFTIISIFTIAIFGYKPSSYFNNLLGHFKYTYFLYAIITFIAINLFMAVYSLLIVKLNGKSETHVQTMIKEYGLVFNIVASVVAGITEEITFRGTIQNILQSHINFIPAIIIPSIIFMIFHIKLYKNISSLFAILGISTVLGVSFYITDSVWTVIIAHALYNLFVTLTSHIYIKDDVLIQS